MIQAMVKKLNGKRLRQRISSAILIVAILVSFSGILGGTAMLVMNGYPVPLRINQLWFFAG